MPVQQEELKLDRCPHCQIAAPRLVSMSQYNTASQSGDNQRHWEVYCCRSCGGLVTTFTWSYARGNVVGMYPRGREVDEWVPERARTYLAQAINSLHAPAGAIMLTASAVDAMLRAKDYKKGDLYSRINQSATDHLITSEMAAWAHDIRLDANDQRHSDESAPLPDEKDAERAIEFALALAEFLFVLPERVKRGRGTSAKAKADAPTTVTA